MNKPRNSRGRPRLGCRVRHYRFTLTLHEGDDDELIAILDSIPKRKRAMAVKVMIMSDGVLRNRHSVEVDVCLDETIDELVF